MTGILVELRAQFNGSFIEADTSCTCCLRNSVMENDKENHEIFTSHYVARSIIVSINFDFLHAAAGPVVTAASCFIAITIYYWDTTWNKLYHE